MTRKNTRGLNNKILLDKKGPQCKGCCEPCGMMCTCTGDGKCCGACHQFKNKEYNKDLEEFDKSLTYFTKHTIIILIISIVGPAIGWLIRR